MSEGLLSRVARVVDAGVDTLVGSAERLAGTGLMRQAVRDVDRAIDDVRARQAMARKQATQAGERRRLAEERAAKLREEARFALVMNREDLAEAAVVEKQVAEADAAAATADSTQAVATEQRLADMMAELEGRRRALAEELRAQEAIAAAGAGSVPSFADRKMERAEQSFTRALGVAGEARGVTVTRIAEIDTLRRNKAVADELAGLRAGLDAPAAPPKKRRG